MNPGVFAARGNRLDLVQVSGTRHAPLTTACWHISQACVASEHAKETREQMVFVVNLFYLYVIYQGIRK